MILLVGFEALVASYGTSEAIRVVEALGRKIATASQIAARKISLEESSHTNQAAETLNLMDKFMKAKDEVEIVSKHNALVKEENVLLKENQKFGLMVAESEKVAENLRKTIERDATELASLKDKVKILEAKKKKKDDAYAKLGADMAKM